jgi:hypothetical protein
VSADILTLVFGVPKSSGEPGDEKLIPVSELPLQKAGADLLNQTLKTHASSADWIVLTNGSFRFNFSPELLEAGTSSDAVVITLKGPLNPWQEFSSSVAAFIPACGRPLALAFHSDSLADQTPFRDVSKPIVDWLIRCQSTGQVISTVTVDASSNSSSNDMSYPALAPSKPGRASRWLADHLEQIQAEELIGKVSSEVDASAFTAGLWQMNDFLDESHRFSQSVEGKGRHAAGDYWHAIMHRREPDASNSKYWFRRVGEHPVFETLSPYARDLLTGYPQIQDNWETRLIPSENWDPFGFVDFCSQATQSQSADMVLIAEQLQWFEMHHLLIQSLRDARGE